MYLAFVCGAVGPPMMRQAVRDALACCLKIFELPLDKYSLRMRRLADKSWCAGLQLKTSYAAERLDDRENTRFASAVGRPKKSKRTMAEAEAFIKGIWSFRCQHDGSWLTPQEQGVGNIMWDQHATATMITDLAVAF